MDINFEYYKIFYYVAKYKNITKAAGVLKSNQPNVTRIIKLLESQLNCRLFIREPRGLQLTKEGEMLYSHVEIACQHLLSAEAEINDRETECKGTVEIGATETGLHLFLLRTLHGFKIKYPEIKIKIRNNSTPEILKALHNGKIDFAVVTTPFAVSENLCCETMLEFKEILVGGEDYADVAEKKLKLSELHEYSLIGLGSETGTYRFYKNLFEEHQVDYELDMEVATSDLILPLIQNNLGIGFVAEELTAPLLEEGKLVQISPDVEVPARKIQMVWDKGRGRSHAADILCKYLENNIKGRT